MSELPNSTKADLRAIQYRLADDKNATFNVASISAYTSSLVQLIEATAKAHNLEEDIFAGVIEQVCHLGLSYAAVTKEALGYMSNVEHHVFQNRRVTAPVRFMLTNSMAGIIHESSMIPRSVNALTPEVGDADPRWVVGALPRERFVGENVDPTTVHIPMKVDTGHEIVYGYYELFVETRVENGKEVRFVTELPAIRSKGNYIIPNSIYRWIEIDDDTVKKHWKSGTDIIPHPKPKEEATDEPVAKT